MGFYKNETSCSGQKSKLVIWVLPFTLALTSLACGFLNRETGPHNRPLYIVRLPTLTPTLSANPTNPVPITTASLAVPASIATEPSASVPTLTPVAALISPTAENTSPVESSVAQPAALGTAIPIENPSPIPPTSQPTQPSPTIAALPLQNNDTADAPPAAPGSAFAFANVRMVSNPEEGLLLYGDMINQSASPQELQRVTATFVDAQGQVIAGEDDTSDYAPVQIVPTKGRIPFELAVPNIQAAANFNLRAEAMPSNSAPRQDFELTTTSQNSDEFGFCFGGTLRNPGADLAEYAVVAAVLYDTQNNVLSFGDTYVEPEALNGGQTAEFEICADSFSQPVSRYELQAWGQ